MHSADGWREVLEPLVSRYRERKLRRYFRADAAFASPEAVEHWSLTALREKPIKIGAKVVRHGRYVTFHLAEVAILRSLFANIPRLIDGLRPAPLPP